MKVDILFLGRLFPRENETEIKSKMKTGMQDAANALQWNIIDGLEDNDCGKIRILNYLPVDSYPNGYVDKNIEEFGFKHTTKYESDDLNVGCTNLSIIKQFVNIVPFKHEIKKWVSEQTTSKKVLVMYTASKMFLDLAKYAKHCNPKIEICCIIADIPEFASATDLHGIKKFYNMYNKSKCDKLYKFVDKFVLLTDQMAERLSITVPYVVMEGIAPKQDVAINSELSDKYKNERYILYTGTLSYKFGIGELLDAFAQIPDKDIKLIICGFGQAENRIREDMKSDPRIVFLGRVDRAAAIALQHGAKVLVNPRQNNEEFTKYSFPSKTMEYLATGVPVVAYKLDGIPNEYDDYINYVENNSVEAFRDKLIEICIDKEGLAAKKAELAKKFVLENKNCKAQSKKILDFIIE